MPDITMCTGEGCEARFTCYRFTAKPSQRQFYFQGSPIKNNGCDFYCNKNYETKNR
jgi:hypothetical protein